MPAPDYPRVPFPDSPGPEGGRGVPWPVAAPIEPRPRTEPGADRWWYEAPIDARIFDGIMGFDKRLAKVAAAIDRWPPAKVAEMIDRGYITGWPWELTGIGKKMLGSLGR